MLSDERYHQALANETDRLAAAVRDADLDATVPTCPEWSLRTLAGHVGQAQRWAARMAAERPDTPPSPPATDAKLPDDPEARASWLRDGAHGLSAAVRASGANAPVWTFDEPPTVRFWLRRMALEVTVHRVDAELTVGAAARIETDLAADCISEGLRLLSSPAAAANPQLAGLAGTGQTMHFHATDDDLGAAGEWFVIRTPDGVRWEHGHHKGDVAVRGRASDLALVLARRVPVADADVTVLGNPELLDWWLERTAF